MLSESVREVFYVLPGHELGLKPEVVGREQAQKIESVLDEPAAVPEVLAASLVDAFQLNAVVCLLDSRLRD